MPQPRRFALPVALPARCGQRALATRQAHCVKTLWLAAAAAALYPAAANTAEITFQADNWTAECRIADSERTIVGDCSVTGVFQDIHVGSAAGSFALLVALEPQAVAIVGRPFPLRAELRVDANPPLTCTGARYCVFSAADTRTITDELNRGSLILVDIATAKSVYRASLSAEGYRVGLAKIRAEEE
jgi:hypothetical protein